MTSNLQIVIFVMVNRVEILRNIYEGDIPIIDALLFEKIVLKDVKRFILKIHLDVYLVKDSVNTIH